MDIKETAESIYQSYCNRKLSDKIFMHRDLFDLFFEAGDNEKYMAHLNEIEKIATECESFGYIRVHHYTILSRIYKKLNDTERAIYYGEKANNLKQQKKRPPIL